MKPSLPPCHVIQPSGPRTSLRDQCFFCLVRILWSFVTRSALVPLESVATPETVSALLSRHYKQLSSGLMGLARKKGERLHDYALRVQSSVRGLAKQGVRLPDQVQGFLLLRRANLSTQARIAIMTLAGNSLSLAM